MLSVAFGLLLVLFGLLLVWLVRFSLLANILFAFHLFVDLRRVPLAALPTAGRFWFHWLTEPVRTEAAWGEVSKRMDLVSGLMFLICFLFLLLLVLGFAIFWDVSFSL